MPFTFSDAHIESYYTHGYTVFQQILPPSLISDLRRVCQKARDIAREKSGGQVQRLQPVAKYDLDQQPFMDYADLPELVDAIARVLTPRHRHGDRERFGVLLEPKDQPWCTHWHRDWRDNASGLPLARWDERLMDLNLFNQVNCALYEDHCTWVVPGSHLRRDLPGEAALFPDRPIPNLNLEGKSNPEREQLCLAYCERMPGAVQLHLNAGDFALYRNTLWHIGNYVPYSQRATIHDSAMTPEFHAWIEETQEVSRKRRTEGLLWENPNEPLVNA